MTYTNESKQQQLRVPEALLNSHGAVSEPVVGAMAQAAIAISGADLSLSISGIAGPDGGTPEKPVGTVWIGLGSHGGVTSRRFVFSGDREMIRDRSAKMALTLLRFHLLEKPVPF